MSPVFLPPSRRLAGALPTALSLLALPALAVAQHANDPPNLGYESATESHRGFDDEAPPADGVTATDPATAGTDAEAVPAAEPEPGAVESGTAAVAPPASGTGAKPAGSRPVPVEPEGGDRPAANEATPAAADAPQRARAFVHDSVLEDYVAYEESDGPNWIEANRVVGEIGGWRTYARELFESDDDEGEAR